MSNAMYLAEFAKTEHDGIDYTLGIEPIDNIFGLWPSNSPYGTEPLFIFEPDMSIHTLKGQWGNLEVEGTGESKVVYLYTGPLRTRHKISGTPGQDYGFVNIVKVFLNEFILIQGRTQEEAIMK